MFLLGRVLVRVEGGEEEFRKGVEGFRRGDRRRGFW